MSLINTLYIHMKREFDAQIRKVGNSYVVTVPSITIKRFKLKEGQIVTVSVSTGENEQE